MVGLSVHIYRDLGLSLLVRLIVHIYCDLSLSMQWLDFVLIYVVS